PGEADPLAHVAHSLGDLHGSREAQPIVRAAAVEDVFHACAEDEVDVSRLAVHDGHRVAHGDVAAIVHELDRLPCAPLVPAAADDEVYVSIVARAVPPGFGKHNQCAPRADNYRRYAER